MQELGLRGDKNFKPRPQNRFLVPLKGFFSKCLMSTPIQKHQHTKTPPYKNTPMQKHPHAETPPYKNTPIQKHPHTKTPLYKNTPIQKHPNTKTPPYKKKPIQKNQYKKKTYKNTPILFCMGVPH